VGRSRDPGRTSTRYIRLVRALVRREGPWDCPSFVDTQDVLKEHGMSENEEKPKKFRRKRRAFTPEFKAGAVKLVVPVAG
jgi:hypothetical protein